MAHKASFRIVVHRIVTTDSDEPPEHAEARRAFVEALSWRSSARLQAARGRLRPELSARLERPLPPPPDVPVWWLECHERERRREDPELDRACLDLQARLRARGDRYVRHEPNGTTLYDFSRALDLLEEWTAVQDAGEERHRARQPPLAIKPGDFVDVAGQPMRVEDVDVLSRTAYLAIVDGEGHVVASESGVPAEQLRPMSAPPKRDPPPIPEELTDSLDRARFRKRQIAQALAAAGLDDDAE